MIKCVCATVKQKDLDEFLANGLTRDEAISRLGIGRVCGRCLEDDEEEEKKEEPKHE